MLLLLFKTLLHLWPTELLHVDLHRALNLSATTKTQIGQTSTGTTSYESCIQLPNTPTDAGEKFVAAFKVIAENLKHTKALAIPTEGISLDSSGPTLEDSWQTMLGGNPLLAENYLIWTPTPRISSLFKMVFFTHFS
jgi:hypothetical protein